MWFWYIARFAISRPDMETPDVKDDNYHAYIDYGYCEFCNNQLASIWKSCKCESVGREFCLKR